MKSFNDEGGAFAARINGLDNFSIPTKQGATWRALAYRLAASYLRSRIGATFPCCCWAGAMQNEAHCAINRLRRSNRSERL